MVASNDEIATNELNEKIDIMKIPGEYFLATETDRILYPDDLQEIEFMQRRLTAEAERF